MKTLYKRIAHAVMILVMLVSLTATASAAKGYGFTTDDEPAEIYAIILRDHSKIAADEYKYALMLYSGAASENPGLSVDDYEIGHKDQYAVSDLQKALNHVPNRINTTTAKTETTSTTETPSTGTSNSIDYASPEAQVFDDVEPGSWYYEAVNAMAAGGLLTGYDDGLFHPDDVITAGQFCVILCRIHGIPYEKWTWNWAEAFAEMVPVYDDAGNITSMKCIGDTKHTKSEHWAHEANTQVAFGMGMYQPLQPDCLDAPLTRGTVLSELGNLFYIMYTGQSVESMYAHYHPGQPIPTFTAEDIPDWDVMQTKLQYNDDYSNWKAVKANSQTAPLAMLLAYNLGVTTGVDENHTCNPHAYVTRAQLCQMLYNMGVTTADSRTPPRNPFGDMASGAKSSGELSE